MRKQGLANHYAFPVGASDKRKVTPGITELSPARVPIDLEACLSWWCSSYQGWGCSPIKRDRELGSHRRETGVLLFGGSARVSDEKVPTVREERGIGASSPSVVRQGIAEQPRATG